MKPTDMPENSATPKLPQTASSSSGSVPCYPDSEGWWWIKAPDQKLVPVMVEKRGKHGSLSVCIPRSSAHYSTWWKSLKSIKGQWFGKVSLPMDNASEIPSRKKP